MISHIIRFSVENKFIVFLLVLALAASGIYSLSKLPIDAVPDITNNQVQVVTSSTSLAPQEVEQFITFPVELAMANIPGVEEIRSISRFGLSVVTIVFEDDIPILEARQFVKEQIDQAKSQIPSEFGEPEMMPITTGLGEIYQYTLQVENKFKHKYTPMELRTIQDWIVKRQLMGTEGIIEVSSFGGYLKQYEVAINPLKMQSLNCSISEVFDALQKNNQNTGGSYIEKGNNAFYIRTEGIVKKAEDIERIVIKNNGDVPVLIRDVAKVGFGHPPRFGAMTMDGKGEVVGGITLMLKGANSSQAIENVQNRVESIQKSLPEGVSIEPYLDRSILVEKTTRTVTKNLVEGGLIVVVVLLLLLGNLRAGLIVASVIPLSLLFAFVMMNIFGVSANLMSLGAIDFGIVIDGAVIVVEGILHFMFAKHIQKKLSQKEMDETIIKTSSSIIGSAAFGVLIILVVFVPIITLTGIEGKMFAPMAKTVSFAIVGALLLSISYVPMMSALFLSKKLKETPTFADKIINKLHQFYRPILVKTLEFPKVVLGLAVAFLILAIAIFKTLGGEFVPTLDEGDLAMQLTIEPGSSLNHMIETSTQAEKILVENFPEVKHVVSKIGTAEVPTDPMAIEDADVMILLKEPEEWVSATSKDELVAKMKEKLSVLDWASFEFTQPIELRFNELISGAKTDVTIKVFGEDLDILAQKGKEIADIIEYINGSGDVKIEQTEGLPQLMINYDRDKIAMYGLNISDLNSIVRSAYAGESVGVVYEGERKFDLTVRLPSQDRTNLNTASLFVDTPNGNIIPLSEVVKVELKEGPMQISRENASRRVAVGINVRDRDIESYINEVQQKLDNELKLDPGYSLEYGGQFKNLVSARNRLAIVIPIALAMIFILLYFAFSSFKHSLLIYATVPLSAVGGVLALYFRDTPFSISAGVGFIALFGVAVLNGIVMISYFNQLKSEGELSLKEIVIDGAITRLRPVIMTASVASLGFLPMALSSSAGAEVQKPLATVVIGGLITATLLTLIVLPVIYYLSEKKTYKMNSSLLVLLFLAIPFMSNSQGFTLQMAIDSAIQNHPEIKNGQHQIEQVQEQQKEVFSLGNTNFNYQYGQMNAFPYDNYFEVDQEIGNPFYKSKRNKELKAMLNVKKEQLELRKKEITRDVKLSYNSWVYGAKVLEIIKSQLEEYSKYLQSVENKYDVGEISKLEYGMSKIFKSDLETKLLQANESYISAEVELKKLTFVKGEFTVPETYFKSYKLIETPQQDINQESLLGGMQAMVTWNNYNVKTLNSNKLPNWSVGYFNQQLETVYGFQGFKLGISIPLFTRVSSIEVNKAKINQSMLTNNLNAEEYRLKKEYQIELKNYSNLVEMHNLYYDEWVSQSEFLMSNAKLELESGEIDYYRYSQAIMKGMDINIKSLELDYKIQQSKSKIEFYTK